MMIQAHDTKLLPKSRILLVSANPFFGGGESYLTKLAGTLAGHYDLRAVVVDSKLADALNALNIPTEQTHTVPPTSSRKYLHMARLLWRTCKTWRPDVLHLNGQSECHLFPLLLLLGTPVVAIRHTPLFSPLVPRLMRPLVSFECRLASAVVCVSEVLRSQLSRAGVKEKGLHYIPNWIESEQVVPCVGDRKQAISDFRLVFVGRLNAIKGAKAAIAAVKQLTGVVLDVVGEGPQRAELEADAKGLPVIFHGFQQDCTQFYDNADLLIFPSNANVEGQGQVPLEAMARGTACLVSDIETMLETTDNGRCAALFRCGDPDDLARQVRALQADPERLHQLRVAGLQRVKQCYTEDAVRDRYLALYESVIQQHASRRGRKQEKR